MILNDGFVLGGVGSDNLGDRLQESLVELKFGNASDEALVDVLSLFIQHRQMILLILFTDTLVLLACVL